MNTEKHFDKRTWLIQRLNRPYKNAKLNPFAFGGGYKNGGLSDEAMDLLNDVFSFDYMGAAEFEWGAVPKSLHAMGQYAYNGNLEAKTYKVGDEEVYVFANVGYANNMQKFLDDLANRKVETKEATHFRWAMGLEEGDYYKKTDCRTIGWLEIDNHFAFFTDRNVANNFAAIFDIEIKD